MLFPLNKFKTDFKETSNSTKLFKQFFVSWIKRREVKCNLINMIISLLIYCITKIILTITNNFIIFGYFL